jgi:hypothetical protein
LKPASCILVVETVVANSRLDCFATDRHDIPDTKSELQLNFVVTANAIVFERDKTGNPQEVKLNVRINVQ